MRTLIRLAFSCVKIIIYNKNLYYQKTYFKNAKKSEYKGSIYDSRFEAQQAFELDLLQRAGEIIKWEKQVKIPLIVNGYIVCDYYVDFVVYRDGETEYIECKGLWTQTASLKWKLFEALFTKPENKLTVIKQGKQQGRPKLRKIKKL